MIVKVSEIFLATGARMCLAEISFFPSTDLNTLLKKIDAFNCFIIIIDALIAILRILYFTTAFSCKTKTISNKPENF